MRRKQLSYVCLLLIAVLFAAGCDQEADNPAAPVDANAPAGSTAVVAPGTKLPVVFPVGPVAPKPEGPLAADASCVTAQCHADMTRGTHIHGPVASQACDSCHAPDTGKHEFPLKRDEVATCTHCHSVAGTQAHQHTALEQGCMTCHKPHTSQAKFLLIETTVGEQCARCHTVPIHRFAHQAVATGECTNCHWPHQSENANLLRGGEGRDHCLSCHDGVRDALASASFVHEPAKGECESCHQPHSAPNAHLLNQPLVQSCLACHKEIQERIADAPVKHGAMATDEGCASCHSAHATDHPELLRARMDQVCLDCHDETLRTPDGREIANMQSVLTESKFLHGPVANGSCSGCHEPHGSMHAGLLEHAYPREFYTDFKQEKFELCFRCHNREMVLSAETQTLTNFRDGERNLHFVHVNREKGRTCRTCHEVHGSNLPNHMASEVPFEGSRWSMPIEYEKRADGGSCTPGCHGPYKYTREAAVLQGEKQ